MSSEGPVLYVQGVTKRYGDKEVLSNATLSIRHGELKILIGPSGGGKSTLLQCINYLVTPEKGRIWLKGKEVNHTSRRDLYAYRQKVGMIFQDFNLFDHLTALGNVQIALSKVKKMPKDQARSRALTELERVGLGGHVDKYPAQLSGGQKQRVSIARALAMDPEVMLLDEPTSALDPELIGEVLTVIRDLAKAGMTMIMATHQISFSATLADEFLFMEEGRIVEHGSPTELLARDCGSRTLSFCAKISELTGEKA